MIVFTCVAQAKRPIVPSTQSLPSARSLPLLQDENGELFQSSTFQEEDLLKLKKDREARQVAAKALETAQRDSIESQSRIKKLEERLRQAEQSLASTLSKQSAGTLLQSAMESVIQSQQATINRLKNEVLAANQEAAAKQQKLEQKEKDDADADSRFVSRRERRARELKELWSIHFPRLDFHQQPLRWAAEQEFRGRLEIERALKEMVEADDPVALSRSKMRTTGEHHSRFTIPKNVECRLFYSAKDGRITIRRLCKKKDC